MEGPISQACMMLTQMMDGGLKGLRGTHLLDISSVQGLLEFVFVSVLCDVQDDVPLPTVPSNPCLFSILHQILFPQLFQPEFFALIPGKSTPYRGDNKKGKGTMTDSWP